MWKEAHRSRVTARTGGDQVTPTDVLTLINHINGGAPYDPSRDVNWDGEVGASDVLLVINFVNDLSVSHTLIPSGAFSAVVQSPPPTLTISALYSYSTSVKLFFSGLPSGSRLIVEGKGRLTDESWITIIDALADEGFSRAYFSKLPDAPSEYYRASFR